MDAYAAAKFRLFSDLPLQSDKHFNAVLNVGDPIGKSFADQLREAITFQVLDSDGGNSTAHWVGYPMETKLNGNRIRISYLGNDLGSFDTPLAGGFNHENVLAALVASVSAGVPLESALRALGQLRPVPGRFEMVTVPADVHVIVDYAHTPDALIKLLSTVRRMTDKRILTVFGCGGDRDRTKRPLMAAAVSSESNLSVVTSDNPRTENAEQIIADVMKGVQSGADAIAITDRKEAIRYALSNARSGDVVIIAGKGHETYQIIGSQKIPFDDRTVVKEHFCS
jgi:UDP-N-acetylmuramoyl-L-alanyl-D-glutamate--2,6-diaminopimelate ligase